MNEVPAWLEIIIHRSLLGEIYQNIRIISASYSADKDLTMNYVLDRPIAESDIENFEIIDTNISSMTDRSQVRRGLIVYSADVRPRGQIDTSGTIIYSRAENDFECE